MQDEVWYQGDASRHHLALWGEGALGCTGRTWAMAENMRLWLPLNSEHGLSAERITLVIAHFELCCPGLWCLSLCLSWAVAARGFGSFSLLSFGFVLCKSSSFDQVTLQIVHGVRAGLGLGLCYVGLCMGTLVRGFVRRPTNCVTVLSSHQLLRCERILGRVGWLFPSGPPSCCHKNDTELPITLL